MKTKTCNNCGTEHEGGAPCPMCNPPSQKDAYVKHFGQLIGKTVKAVAVSEQDGDTEEAFGLMFTDGTVAWVMTDPECNGQGWLDITK